MSAISLIEEMKDLQRPNPEPSDGGGQILAMLRGQGVLNPRQYSEEDDNKSSEKKKS